MAAAVDIISIGMDLELKHIIETNLIAINYSIFTLRESLVVIGTRKHFEVTNLYKLFLS